LIERQYLIEEVTLLLSLVKLNQS